MKSRILTDFVDGYIDCALWCGVIAEVEEGDTGHSIDEHYVDQLSAEALETLEADAVDFFNAHQDILEPYDKSRAGQDFWLTRNGHGAGFWDGGYSSPEYQTLTMDAKAYGSCDLYLVQDSDGNDTLEVA